MILDDIRVSSRHIESSRSMHSKWTLWWNDLSNATGMKLCDWIVGQSCLYNSPHPENWKEVHFVRPRVVLWWFCIHSSSFFAGSCSEHPSFEPKYLHQPTWLLQVIEWLWHSGSHLRFSLPGVPTGLALACDAMRYRPIMILMIYKHNLFWAQVATCPTRLNQVLQAVSTFSQLKIKFKRKCEDYCIIRVKSG